MRVELATIGKQLSLHLGEFTTTVPVPALRARGKGVSRRETITRFGRGSRGLSKTLGSLATQSEFSLSRTGKNETGAGRGRKLLVGISKEEIHYT